MANLRPRRDGSHRQILDGWACLERAPMTGCLIPYMVGDELPSPSFEQG